MGREIVGRGHRKSFCFPARKFKAVRGTTTKVKLSTEHTPLVSKTKIPCIVHNADLTKVYPVVKKIIGKIIPSVPLADRLKHFVNSWEMLTRDQDISFVVISFSKKPYQKKIPGNIST